MNIKDYYKFILEKVKNPDFVNFTNQYNEVEKRKLLSVFYSKIHAACQKKPVSVFKVESRYVHEVFKRIYNDAVKWSEEQKQGGLETKIETATKEKQPELFPLKSDFERHMEALDGAGYYRYHYHKH